jgi:hypothetical protein
MAAALRSVVLVAIAVAGGALIALPSCEGLPSKTCFGEHANALTAEGGAAVASCTSCLQEKCCDLVGRCDEQQGCIAAFRTAHKCVLDNGPDDESRCIDPLGGKGQLGRDLYDCMRARCGAGRVPDAPCGISSCNADPSVVLFATPRCDRCISGSCCQEVNECYADRRCKLALECILRDCKDTVGGDMSAFADAGAAAVRAVLDSACAVNPGNVGALVGGRCIVACVEAFAPFDGGTADDRRARCLALGTYACGAEHACGPECAPAPPPPPDGDAGAETGPPDASGD